MSTTAVTQSKFNQIGIIAAAVLFAAASIGSAEPVLLPGADLQARASSNYTEISMKPMEEIKKITEPVEEAVTRAAEVAAREMKEVARGAHSLGGKIIQGLINIMIAASPGKTRVYLPATASDPDSGVTLGILPVFLFVDKKDTIRHIHAPSLTYNETWGVNATMRYYWYPRPRSQLFTIASYAEETNRRFTLRYEDPAFYLDWLYFKFDFSTWQNGAYRYFGIGPKSDFGRQSNYTLKENTIKVLTGVNFLEHFRFILGHRFRRADISQGPITSLPAIRAFDPRPVGLEDPMTIMSQSVSLSYDTRDLPVAPVKGHFVNLFVEFVGNIGGDTKFQRFGFEMRGFIPLKENRYVTGWRVMYEGENGKEDVPFYERSLLGGRSSLRGFGVGRFIDSYKASYHIEERIRLYTFHAFNVNIDFELTPFYEAGTVFPRRGKSRSSDLHHVVGIGFRSVVRPNVVGVIDLGFGEDGSALYVGIDYPF